ncbi:MAG: phage major capsid protein [Planctomycetota bacterium]
MAVAIAGKSAKQLAEERAEIITKAQSHREERGDDWGADDDRQFDEMMTDAEKLGDAIKSQRRLELAQGLTLEDREPGDDGTRRPDPNAGGPSERRDEPTMVEIRMPTARCGRREYCRVPVNRCGTEDYQKAFTHFVGTRQGAVPLLESAGENGGLDSAHALTSDGGPQAGFLITSQQFAAGILKEADDLLFIRQWAKIHTVAQSGSLGIRSRNKRMNTFDWGPEVKTAPNDSELSYGKKVLTPHYLTGSTELSRDLARRSMGGAEAEVRSELARDGAEKMEDGYMVGDGQEKPLGVFTPSDDGIPTSRDVVTGANDNFTFDGLQSMKYALKQQYRRGQRGSVRWLLHRDGIRRVVLLKDNDGQPIFKVGAGIPQDGMHPEDELLNFPVDESERAPNTFSAGNYVALLAAWQHYEIADALDFELQVLDQTQARRNMYEYIARFKTDGMPTLGEAFVRGVCGT